MHNDLKKVINKITIVLCSVVCEVLLNRAQSTIFRHNSPSLSSLTSEVVGASDFQERAKSRSAFLEMKFCISTLSTLFSFLKKETHFMKTYEIYENCICKIFYYVQVSAQSFHRPIGFILSSCLYILEEKVLTRDSLTRQPVRGGRGNLKSDACSPRYESARDFS